MLTPGTSLMGRYEILERIGAGGMAEVYKAKDTALNRFVAVKILRQEYCSDETFVRKFRVEAQSAAGLQHPNIVSVYDVGEEKDMHYIIMELIDGITLKNYIDMKKKLDIRETLNISVQIAQGLSAAHANRIIHRDIKPQNIIISRDGKVKVTDFGIARMADSHTVTTTAAGTVSYISPEQARGGYSDEKSDIYSLGITMYEMLTGKVPYEGETNVAVAIKHIQAEMVPPRELEPSIPRSFEKIILKCTQKKPEWRYATVQDLITDLRQVLIQPDGDYVKLPGSQQLTKDTVVINGEDISAIGALVNKESASSAGNGQEVQDSFRKTFLQEGDDTSAEGSSGSESEKGQDPYKPAGSERVDGLHGNEAPDMPPGLTREEEEKLIEEEEEEVDSQMGKILMIMGIAGFIILIAVLGVLAAYITGLAGDGFGSSKKKSTETETSQLDTSVTTEAVVVETESVSETESEIASETAAETETDATVMVPSLLGKTEDEALKLLEERKLEAEVEDGTSNHYEVGQVYEQSIEAGTKVDVHTTVTIYICKGTEAFSLENVTGINYERAASMLKTMGLKVQVKFVDDNSMNVDEVAYTEPEFGSPVVEGDTVILYVCQGASAEFISVPDLKGKDIDTAISEIEAAGLTYNGKSSDYSDTYPEGQVMDQSVAAWTSVEKGSNISLTVSMGPRSAAETEAQTEPAETEAASQAQETQPADDTIYTATVPVPNPFEAGYKDENGDTLESAQITVIIEQDGVQSNLFDEEVDQYSFPSELTSMSTSASSATVTEYINGQYYESWTVNYE